MGITTTAVSSSSTALFSTVMGTAVLESCRGRHLLLYHHPLKAVAHSDVVVPPAANFKAFESTAEDVTDDDRRRLTIMLLGARYDGIFVTQVASNVVSNYCISPARQGRLQILGHHILF